MKHKSIDSGSIRFPKFFLVSLFIGLSFFSSHLNAQTITTDLLDYPPGSAVTISGNGWNPGETVTVRVTHNPISIEDSLSIHQPWDVVADGSGNFTTVWYVPMYGYIGASLMATADGSVSGIHA